MGGGARTGRITLNGRERNDEADGGVSRAVLWGGGGQPRVGLIQRRVPVLASTWPWPRGRGK